MGTFKVTTKDGVEHEVFAEASVIQAPGVLLLITNDEPVALFPLQNVLKVLIPDTKIVAPNSSNLRLLPSGGAA